MRRTHPHKEREEGAGENKGKTRGSCRGPGVLSVGPNTELFNIMQEKNAVKCRVMAPVGSYNIYVCTLQKDGAHFAPGNPIHEDRHAFHTNIHIIPECLSLAHSYTICTILSCSACSLM